MGLPLGSFGAPLRVALPAVSAGPLGHWYTRRVVPAYTGPLFRLNRLADAATLDLTQNPDGTPDLSGVAAFLNGADFCRVDTVYDQSGGGNHLTQTTAGLMPFFRPANAIRGRPAVTFDGSQNSAYFNIPSAITSTGRSVTIVTVASVISTNAGVVAVVGGGGAGTLTQMLGGGLDNRLPALTSGSGSSFLYGPRRVRSQAQATAVASGPATVTLHADGFAAAVAQSGTDGTWAGGRVGRDNGSNTFNGEWLGLSLYPAQLPGSEVGAVLDVLDRAFDCLTPGRTNAQLVMAGNSIVQGTGATMNVNLIRQAEPLFDRRIRVSNRGVFGQTAATQSGSRAAFLAQFDPTLAVNLILVGDPVNDVLSPASPTTGSGANVWNTYTLPDIQAYQAVYGAANVLVPTMMGHAKVQTGGTAAAYAAERDGWNNLVYANQGTLGYTVVDYAAVPGLQNALDLTRFPDGVHPSTLGYADGAPVLAAAVNSRL